MVLYADTSFHSWFTWCGVMTLPTLQGTEKVRESVCRSIGCIALICSCPIAITASVIHKVVRSHTQRVIRGNFGKGVLAGRQGCFFYGLRF